MSSKERKRNRLKEYDYSQIGAYFITICTKDRKNLFYDVGATFGRPFEERQLSKMGKLVDDEIIRLSQIFENVAVDKYIIMPDHIHLIIMLSRDKGGRPEDAPTVSKIIQQFKGCITKKAGLPVWQKGFYDHIIRNEQDYLEIWDYIDLNPAKQGEKEYLGRSEKYWLKN